MPMKKQLPKTTRNVLAEAIRNEVKKILREMGEASSSLSPEAEKALEQSKIAKQNKDAQKKRAAAKQSMRGMSVEGVDPSADDDFDFETGKWTTADEDAGSTYYPYDDDDDSHSPYGASSPKNNQEYYIEQFSRMPGDKLQSDEGDFFDTTDLHGEDDFAPADEIGLYDEVPGGFSDPEDFMDPYPEDESVKIREQRDVYDPYSPGPREYSDEPESLEYDEQEAWEWDAEMVDDEWDDYGKEY
jgi:hypothetical protein